MLDLPQVCVCMCTQMPKWRIWYVYVFIFKLFKFIWVNTFHVGCTVTGIRKRHKHNECEACLDQYQATLIWSSCMFTYFRICPVGTPFYPMCGHKSSPFNNSELCRISVSILNVEHPGNSWHTIRFSAVKKSSWLFVRIEVHYLASKQESKEPWSLATLLSLFTATLQTWESNWLGQLSRQLSHLLPHNSQPTT